MTTMKNILIVINIGLIPHWYYFIVESNVKLIVLIFLKWLISTIWMRIQVNF